MTRPTPSSAGFGVDLARAPDAIRELENALEQLREIREDARALGRITPPARDQVSIDAAQVLSAMAVGGPGSFVHAADEGICRLQEIIVRLRGDLESYLESDEGGADILGRAGHA